jgi:hypothetical protein
MPVLLPVTATVVSNAQQAADSSATRARPALASHVRNRSACLKCDLLIVLRNQPSPGSARTLLPFGAVILPSSSAFVTRLKDCSVRRTVTPLPGDSPVRDCGSVGVRPQRGRFPGYAW